MVCHASGAANAPKLGDRQVWAPYAARGADALLATVLTGRRHAPRGGSSADEATLRAAVEYMLSSAR